jgi:hypothetical protein
MEALLSKKISINFVNGLKNLILLVLLLMKLVEQIFFYFQQIKRRVMQIFGPKTSYEQARGFTIVKSAPQYVPVNFRTISIIAVVVVISNLFTFSLIKTGDRAIARPLTGEIIEDEPSLYLIDKASLHVADAMSFEEKVREVAEDLEIAPEWLMAVMYSESKFDAAVMNHRGSGAVGLIQWMPTTAKELGVSIAELKKLGHEEQLDYVYKYLDSVRKRYRSYDSLTDLYLAILYPKALQGDYCYTLYATPSQKYKQNVGLDENNDGRVTVSDIDKRMQRIFPTAYMTDNQNS